MTVSLAQPDGLLSLLAGGSAVDSYLFAPPSTSRCATWPTCIECDRAASCSAVPSPRASWTTTRFHHENPKHVAAFLAGIRDAIALIRTDKTKAAAIYLNAEPSKLPRDLFAKILEDPYVRFTLAPENSVKIAKFLARIGTLKQKPADWKDAFFPKIHGENGS